MILVTGATGHLGTSVIAQLLRSTQPGNIVAFARSEEKAKALREKGVEVRTGNFEDVASLDRAMQGIEKVLLISTTDHHRLQQHKNVVDAAVKAGVQHIAYTGVAMKDLQTSAISALMESHFQTEDHIRESGLAYTFLRNTLYTDVIPIYTGGKVFETGILFPAGNGKVAYALRREMGEATANVLLQDGHQHKIYNITGSELYSFEEIAEALSALGGRTVSYTSGSVAEYQELLEQAGIPGPMIPIIAGFGTDIKNGQFAVVADDLEKLLGRKPALLRESLKEVYHL